MANIKMLNMAGAEVGEITLNDAIFGIEPNEYAVHATVKNYLANQRQGTQSAKTRSEVRGGGRKPFRQKGTGRHRQGSTTDPSQIGGGIVFAPKPRDYSYLRDIGIGKKSPQRECEATIVHGGIFHIGL